MASAGKPMLAPSAHTAVPGKMPKWPDATGRGAKSASPNVTNVEEATRTRFIPIRFSSHGAPQPPTKKKIAAGGRNARPAYSGEKPRICCKYTVSTMSAPAEELTTRDKTFAVSVVLRRRKARGINGAFDRYSIARKAANARTERPRGSAAWTVKRPSVAAIVTA